MEANPAAIGGEPSPPVLAYGLRHNALSPLEVLAQSIAAIAPSTIPVFTIPVVCSLAGNGAWLSLAIAMAAMVLVALCIAVFARDSSSAGSLYVYVRNTLPPAFAAAVAWGLLFAYVLTACSCMGGVMIFAARWHLPLPPALVPSVVALIAFAAVYREIKISARIMLWVEAVSVSLISLVVLLTLGKRGLHLDPAQLHLTGATPAGIRLGVMMAIFGFVGFESATTLGSEARQPLRTIPRAVLRSALAAGLFYLVCCYTEAAAFHTAGQDLGASTSPLRLLADRAGLPLLGLLIDAGVLVSLFSAIIACAIASARVLLLMSHHGLVPRRLTRTHPRHETPIAAALLAVLMMAVPNTVLALRGTAGIDIYGWLGTLSVFGFLTAYGIVVVAMPVHLRHRGRLGPGSIALSISAASITLFALVGSIYPMPAAPYRYFPWVYAAYLAAGMSAWTIVQRRSARRTSTGSADARETASALP